MSKLVRQRQPPPRLWKILVQKNDRRFIGGADTKSVQFRRRERKIFYHASRILYQFGEIADCSFGNAPKLAQLASYTFRSPVLVGGKIRQLDFFKTPAANPAFNFKTTHIHLRIALSQHLQW